MNSYFSMDTLISRHRRRALQVKCVRPPVWLTDQACSQKDSGSMMMDVDMDNIPLCSVLPWTRGRAVAKWMPARQKIDPTSMFLVVSIRWVFSGARDRIAGPAKLAALLSRRATLLDSWTALEGHRVVLQAIHVLCARYLAWYSCVHV